MGSGRGALDLLQVASNEFQGQRKTIESRAPLRTDVLLDLLPDPVVKTCTQNRHLCQSLMIVLPRKKISSKLYCVSENVGIGIAMDMNKSFQMQVSLIVCEIKRKRFSANSLEDKLYRQLPLIQDFYEFLKYKLRIVYLIPNHACY